jgi:hypothetical protein
MTALRRLSLAALVLAFFLLGGSVGRGVARARSAKASSS